MKEETWPRQALISLITSFKHSPLLYDEKHPDFSNLKKRNAVLSGIAANVNEVRPGTSVESVTLKLNSLKKLYLKEKAKLLELRKENITKPYLWYYYQLQFLDSYVDQERNIPAIPKNVPVISEDDKDTEDTDVIQIPKENSPFDLSMLPQIILTPISSINSESNSRKTNQPSAASPPVSPAYNSIKDVTSLFHSLGKSRGNSPKREILDKDWKTCMDLGEYKVEFKNTESKADPTANTSRGSEEDHECELFARFVSMQLKKLSHKHRRKLYQTVTKAIEDVFIESGNI